MKIAFRLEEVLSHYNLDSTGFRKKLGDVMDYAPPTISGLLSGKPKNLDFEKLELLVTWLVANGVPSEKLPAILFEIDDLWDRVLHAARVDIVLGETPVPWTRDTISDMVASRDLEVAAKIVQVLTLRSHRSMDLNFKYVPIKYSETGDVPAQQRRHASEMFAEMRKNQMADLAVPSVTFFVASQRKNLLVELLVASCFGCTPFVASAKHRVPFYMMYRDGVPILPSCFGGRNPPKTAGANQPPGIYYRAEAGWQFLPYDANKTDAGLVFITFQESTKALEVALYGFSSAATLAVGRYFLENADKFWPPVARLVARDVGAYVCRLNWTNGTVNADCEMIPLSKKALEMQP